MAVPFYRLRWQGVGSPAGFFILRWDDKTEAWWVIDNYDGDQLEVVATWVARNKKTLGQAGGDYSLYDGWHRAEPVPEQVFDDYWAYDYWATHYQIIQHFPLIGTTGSVSTYYTTPPTAGAAPWSGNTQGDQLIRLKKRYAKNFQAKSLEVINRPSGAPVVQGKMSIYSSWAGKSWAPAMTPTLCNRSAMLEIAGESIAPNETNAKFKIHDIVSNVLVWR